MIKKFTLPVIILFLLSSQVCGQTFQGCDTNAIKAAFAAAGHYTQLIVDGEPCSLYFIDNTSYDAAQAEANAQTLGGNTVVMENAQENQNVVNALNAIGFYNSGNVIWLGYHRTGTGDGFPFQPLDGSPLNYTNWNAGEPNDDGFGGGANSPGCYIFGSCLCTGQAQYQCDNGEQCVQMYSSGLWNDLACNTNSESLVEVNLCPQITTSPDVQLCNTTTSINLTSSTILGSPPFTYSWNPGGQNTSGITVTPTTTTTYTVTATDRYSCYASKSITATVVNVAAPTVTATPSSLCVNQTTTINYTPTGTYSGTAVFTWGFSGGTVVGSSAPYTESWATAGPENVTLFLTDQGCTGPTASAPITVNNTPVANAGPAVSVCSGASVTLGVASVAGVTYSWSPGLGLSSASASNPTFSAVNPGTTTLSYPYVLTASENNCSATSSATVTLYPPIDNSFTISPTSLCTGDNATITYTGTNDPSATYTWNFGGATVVSGTTQGPYTVNWTTAGNPSVTLSVNENGCTAVASSVSVTVNSIPVAHAGPDVQFCSGATANLGSAPVNGVTYSWSPTLGLSNSAIANPTITAVNPGSVSLVQNYTVTASQNGCSATDVAVVTLWPPIVTTFSINPASVCINTNTTITYTGTDSATAVYTWNFDAGNIVSGSGQGPYVVNWSTAGNPGITLNINQDGCTGPAGTQTVAVGNPPVANAGGNQTVCSGGTVQLGTAAVGAVVYTWSPATHLDNANTAQPDFSYSNTGATPQPFTYTVTANDNGCTASDQATITVSPPVVVTIVASGPLEFCDGQTVTLSLASAYSAYLWSNNNTTPTLTVSAAGTFAVAAVDATGCQYVAAPVTVIVDPNPTVSLVQLTNEQCYNVADGSITVAGGTGTPGYTYTWSTLPAQSAAAITHLAPGPYVVTVTDQKNCSVTGQYNIDSAQFFEMTIDSTRNASCYGFSDGAIYPKVQGGTPAYTYRWSNGNNGEDNENLAAGTYSLTTTDANGCPATDSAVITQPVQIVITAPDSLNINFDTHVTLQLSVSPPDNYTYQWTPSGALSCDNCPNPVSFAPQNTTYNVTVTGTDGCVNSITFTLIVDAGKHLFIPNVFTPGNASVNNIFQVYTFGESYFHMQVFDRWGEKVYETNSLEQGWDGTFKGKPVQAGVYVYQVTISYDDGQTLKRDGAVTVLR